MDEVFGHPERFFAASLARNGAERVQGIDALRANDHVIGYGLTGAVDQVMCGEGLASTFRELKGYCRRANWSPRGFAVVRVRRCRSCLLPHAGSFRSRSGQRWSSAGCRSTHPRSGLRPGRSRDMAARIFHVVSRGEQRPRPNGLSCARRNGDFGGIGWQIRLPSRLREWRRGHGGFCHGAGILPRARPRGWLRHSDRNKRPDRCRRSSARSNIHLWDGGPIDASRPVLWWNDSPPHEAAAAVAACKEVVDQGGTVICLNARMYIELAEAAGREAHVGEASFLYSWLYLRDDWARRHRAFAGLPAGGLLDYATYRDLIGDAVFRPGQAEVTAIAGAVKVSQGYDSALTLWEGRFGRGRLIGSTFRLAQLVGHHPVADRLLSNLMVHAASPVAR